MPIPDIIDEYTSASAVYRLRRSADLRHHLPLVHYHDTGDVPDGGRAVSVPLSTEARAAAIKVCQLWQQMDSAERAELAHRMRVGREG